MSHYPDNLMPARVKSEAEDAKGNRQIVSASDYNVHDEEIRAIEKLVGVRKLPLSSGGSVPEDACSLVGAITMLSQAFSKLRDDLVETASGVVAVKDPSVAVDGKIPFPAAWHTTLVSDIPDASTTNDDKMAVVEVDLVSVAGLPEEGYITIINDISPAMQEMCYGDELKIVSPATAYARAGEAFSYRILTATPAKVTLDSVPDWMIVSGNVLSGTLPVVPLSSYSVSITLTGANGASATSSLTIMVFTDLPAISIANFTTSDAWGYYLIPEATEGEPYVCHLSCTPNTLPITSWELTWTSPTSPFPGISMLGNTIMGTPQWLGPPPILPWVVQRKITVKVTDIFGKTASQNFWLTINSHIR